MKIAEAQNETLYRTEQGKSKAAVEAVARETELQRQLTETEVAKREADRKFVRRFTAGYNNRSGTANSRYMAMFVRKYSNRNVLQ